MCHELAMFWNKKQVLHKGTYGIIIEFSKPGTVPARKGGTNWELHHLHDG